eukprot:2564456-Rhodomonas_salina.1
MPPALPSQAARMVVGGCVLWVPSWHAAQKSTAAWQRRGMLSSSMWVAVQDLSKLSGSVPSPCPPIQTQYPPVLCRVPTLPMRQPA